MIQFRDNCDKTDPDREFFNSLLPSVHAFTEDQKLEFRAQSISLIQRIKSGQTISSQPPDFHFRHHSTRVMQYSDPHYQQNRENDHFQYN